MRNSELWGAACGDAPKVAVFFIFFPLQKVIHNIIVFETVVWRAGC
jgi:hypothetical protein